MHDASRIYIQGAVLIVRLFTGIGRLIGGFIIHFFKLSVAVGIIFLLVGFGGCVYVNFFQGGESDVLPDTRYEIILHATNAVLYSNDAVDNGQTVTVDGYYELVDDRYQYRAATLKLERYYWGPITVRRK